MARTVNPQEHARRRAQIVAAAAVEFAERGIDATSTAAICRRAGIGSGTLFHYFGTKREIVHAVFADDLPRVEALCARALADDDPDRGLDLIVDHLLAELADPLAPGLATAAALQAGRDADFAAMLAATDTRIRASLATLLRRANRQTGRSLPLPPASAARWIHGLVDAGHLGVVDGPRARTARELRRIADWLAGR
ncbi:MAG TPA: TetR/AcrR family transcriptional regulator [Actinocatenispora sp.]